LSNLQSYGIMARHEKNTRVERRPYLHDVNYIYFQYACKCLFLIVTHFLNIFIVVIIPSAFFNVAVYFHVMENQACLRYFSTCFLPIFKTCFYVCNFVVLFFIHIIYNEYITNRYFLAFCVLHLIEINTSLQRCL